MDTTLINEAPASSTEQDVYPTYIGEVVEESASVEVMSAEPVGVVAGEVVGVPVGHGWRGAVLAYPVIELAGCAAIGESMVVLPSPAGFEANEVVEVDPEINRLGEYPEIERGVQPPIPVQTDLNDQQLEQGKREKCNYLKFWVAALLIVMFPILFVVMFGIVMTPDDSGKDSNEHEGGHAAVDEGRDSHFSATLPPTLLPTYEKSLTESAKLLPHVGDTWDRFGFDVAIHENTVVIGSPGTWERGGSAYIFVHDEKAGEWIEEAKLVTNDYFSYNFGASVAIYGSTVIIGAPVSRYGSVYVFVRGYETGHWSQEAKLTRSDAGRVIDEHFGFGDSVAVFEDALVVGSWHKSRKNTGFVHLFARKDDGDGAAIWSLEDKLRLNGMPDYNVGPTVGIFENTVVVGGNGASYIFEREEGYIGWREKARLQPSDNSWFHGFGSSVAIYDDVVVVGAERGPAAYVFVRDDKTGNWTEQAKIVAIDKTDHCSSYLGCDVAFHNDTVVIGTQDEATYLFTRDKENGTWLEQMKLIASDGADDYFGRNVGIYGKTVIVGALGNDDNGENSGSAYFFSIPLS